MLVLVVAPADIIFSLSSLEMYKKAISGGDLQPGVNLNSTFDPQDVRMTFVSTYGEPEDDVDASSFPPEPLSSLALAGTFLSTVTTVLGFVSARSALASLVNFSLFPGSEIVSRDTTGQSPSEAEADGKNSGKLLAAMGLAGTARE